MTPGVPPASAGPLMDHEEAGALVEARLGRGAQDSLEAAVVLEAWGGVRARRALALGAELVASDLAAEPSRPPDSYADPDERRRVWTEALALVTAIVAIAAWTAPIGADLGAAVVERALFLALPLTLGLQWFVRSRYLASRDGLGRLKNDKLLAAGLSVAIVSLPSLALGLAGFVAGVLTLTWVGGVVVTRRGWGLGYALLVVAVAAALERGAPSVLLIGGAAVVIVCVIVVILARTTAQAGGGFPWRRALPAGLIGATLGAALVADPSVGWGVRGALPALALIPSIFAGFVGGLHLSTLRAAIPESLHGVCVSKARQKSLFNAGIAIVAGASARLVATAAALSVVLAVGSDALGTPVAGPGLFLGFGAVSLATLFLILLDAFGQARAALAAVVAGLAAEIALYATGATPFAGAGLVCGGVAVTIIALPSVFVLLRHPGRTLATALWIN